MPMADVPKTQVTILIIEDQFFSKLALRAVIESQQDFLIIGEAGTGAAGAQLSCTADPNDTVTATTGTATFSGCSPAAP